MDKLPCIPTPPAQRWREFRIQVLPLIIFTGILFGVVLLWRNFVATTGIVGEGEAIKADAIKLQEAGKILRAGTQMELIKPALVRRDANHVEVNLPEFVQVPDKLKLVPGEFVDVSPRPTQR